MTADDIYGHTYIDSNGALHKEEPEHWAIHYCYIENEGWGFMRRGPERRTNITINPAAKIKDIPAILERVKGRLEEKIYKALEKMVDTNKRSSTISD